MHGIGKRTVDKWIKNNIVTIGDLARASDELLSKKFGDRAMELKRRANGHDDRPVNPHAYSDYKSIGHSTTLRADTNNMTLIQSTLEQLAKRVQTRLRKKDLFAGGVQLTIRYHNWKMITKSRKLLNPIQNEEELLREARLLFNKAWNEEKIRLLGISTYDLIEKKHAYKQLDLFTYKEDEKRHELNETMIKLQEKFGENIVHKGWKKQEEEKG